jgi:hypothetical protein
MRALGPLFPAMARVAMLEMTADESLRRLDMLAAFMDAFSKMDRDKVDGLVTQCFQNCGRVIGGNGAGPVQTLKLWQGRDLFEDMDVATLIQICWEVIQENLGGFFATVRGPETSTLPSSAPATPASFS